MIPWKLAEAAFGRIWLLLIPIVVAPIVAAAAMQETPMYWSTATVWVSRPENVDPGVLLRSALPWETPAQAQAQVLRDLLGTETFRSDVAAAADLDGADATARVWRELGVGAAGTNLVTITATSPHGRDAEALVDGMLAEYERKATQVAAETARLQINYLDTQLSRSTEELELRQTALSEYLAEHPGAADPFRVDKEFRRLSTSVDAQQLVVEGIVSALLNAERAGAAAPQGLEATFSIQDNASEAQLLGVPLTKRLGYPFMAMLVGAAISATYLYIAYRLDHAIRTSQDLVDLPVPVLGFVPEVKGGKPRLLSHPPMKWLAIGNNRDYARMVAAAMSNAAPGEV